MKKKHIVISVIFLLFIGILCLINMNNFYLGSNSMFYRTVSDYPNTKWICTEPKAVIEVIGNQYDVHSETCGSDTILTVYTNGVKNEFRVYTMANKIELCRLDVDGNEIDNARYDGNENAILTKVKYRKNILGNVTSFQIKVFYDEQSINGYKTLEFTKEK